MLKVRTVYSRKFLCLNETFMFELVVLFYKYYTCTFDHLYQILETGQNPTFWQHWYYCCTCTCMLVCLLDLFVSIVHTYTVHVAPSYIVIRSMPVASIFRLKKLPPTTIPQLAMTTGGGLQMRSTTAEVHCTTLKELHVLIN